MNIIKTTRQINCYTIPLNDFLATCNIPLDEFPTKIELEPIYTTHPTTAFNIVVETVKTLNTYQGGT